MISVGVKQLKAELSSYIDRVTKGEHIVITEHGKEVAIIAPVSKERKTIHALVATGRAHWSGGKPQGLDGIKTRGKPLSKTILEERA